MTLLRGEIVATGSELTRGQTVNTNAAWIADALLDFSVDCAFHSTCSDDPQDIADTLRHAAARSELIVITGGLGPTEDDRTAQVIAQVLNVDLIRHPEAVELVKARFEQIGYPMAERQLKQADLPDGVSVLRNGKGTAPGFAGYVDGTPFVSLPGVPREMKAMLLGPAIEWLKAEKRLEDVEQIHRSYWKIANAPESEVDSALNAARPLEENQELGLTVKNGTITVALIERGDHQDASLAERINGALLERFGKRVYTRDRRDLSQALAERLIENDISVAVAESCTGGHLAASLAAVPGVSAVFKGGVVAYENAMKMEFLGVKQATLDACGAVSEEVAREMVEGVARRTGAELCVATTGIAGPGGGTEEKPVGTVWIATRYGTNVEAWQGKFHGDREQVQARAVNAALGRMWDQLGI